MESRILRRDPDAAFLTPSLHRNIARMAEPGNPVVDVRRQIGVSKATYYTCKKKFRDLA